MNVEFEHNYQMKVMSQAFGEPTSLGKKSDVLLWRSAWTKELQSWHSPYKLLLDCSQLTVTDSDEVRSELALMIRFFEGLFLRKVVGFGYESSQGHDLLPFDVVDSEEDASRAVGLKEPLNRAKPGDFRSSIQIQNDFRRHVVEISFAVPCKIEDAEAVTTLRSKLTNNLMQWHSKWNLLIDCGNLEFSPELHADFALLEKSLRGFFLKTIIGYGHRGDPAQFPFKVYRSRHKAVAQLESEGQQDGDLADCRSRQS